MRTYILNPTGNITALVVSPYDDARKTSIAAEIMREHPEVEQVGFVCFNEFPKALCNVTLEMAGGEFCGNASISAAALYCRFLPPAQLEWPISVRLMVSGARESVDVSVQKVDDNCYKGTVQIPQALEIRHKEFSFGNITEALPIVHLGGISHIIIQPDSQFWTLKNEKQAAEEAVHEWCDMLEVPGLGLLFLEGNEPDYHLTPLVYVPGSKTTVWEQSCASGLAAVGMYLAEKENRFVSLSIREPGGIQYVESDPSTRKTLLTGTVLVE